MQGKNKKEQDEKNARKAPERAWERREMKRARN